MKKGFVIIWTVLAILTFFFPAIISFITWNFWYMLLFWISWIPTLCFLFIGLIIGSIHEILE
jgi:hypothetical protein